MYRSCRTVAKRSARSWAGLLLALLILGAARPAAADNSADLAEVGRLWARIEQLREDGRSVEAVPLARGAVALGEKLLGPGHADVGERVGDLAVLLDDIGDYASAEPLFRRSLAIQEKALGAHDARVALALSNLGGFLREKGDYVGAEPLHRRALAIWEETHGPRHLDVAHGLSTLAGLLDSKGDFAGAEPLLRRALDIRESALGPDDPTVAQALNNLGFLLTEQLDYERAEPLLRRALAIGEKTPRPNHPGLATTLSHLALLLSLKGKPDEAEPLYRRALAIREKELGLNHPDLAKNLNSLGSLLTNKGDYVAAEPLLRRALALNEKAFGPDHPKVAASLWNLSALLQAKGDYAAAQTPQIRAIDSEDRRALLVLQSGSLRQKQAFFGTLLSDTSGAISFHVQGRPTEQSALDFALRTLLRRKGLAAEVGGVGLRALVEHADPADREKLTELSSRRAELAQSTLGAPPAGTSGQQHRDALERQRQGVERLERELSARYSELKIGLEPVDIKAIQAALPAGAVLVEYAVYKPYNPRAKLEKSWGFPRYVAYILPARGAATYAELGDALPIERAVANYRFALERQDPKFADYSRTLDSLVMEPVRQKLDGATDIYVAPDGVLNLAPFTSLLDEQGHYLVERYRFNLLTTGRDLLRYRERLEPRSPPLVVGGPAYGSKQAHHEPGGDSRAARPVDFGQVYFPPLEGALQESQEIGKLLPRALVLTDAQATEGALKQAHAPRILHIATHGFFLETWQDSWVGRRGLELSTSPGDRTGPVALPDDPMLRSGLAFAGANLRQSGSDDGILTALEASALDLWGTQLVVLSACETGLGQVNNGDGVYGLRRALVVSGSETQVMSLWKVDDQATRQLMTDYYRRVLGGGARIDALRQAQLAMLETPATSHPYYWAAFIAAGDGRTLDYRAAPPMGEASSDSYNVEPKRSGCACQLAALEQPSSASWMLLGVALMSAMTRRSRRVG